jgi:hypothetical protein
MEDKAIEHGVCSISKGDTSRKHGDFLELRWSSNTQVNISKECGLK